MINWLLLMEKRATQRNQKLNSCFAHLMCFDVNARLFTYMDHVGRSAIFCKAIARVDVFELTPHYGFQNIEVKESIMLI